MSERARSAKRAASPNWLASLLGAALLISAGFMLGLVFGVVKEEPELVMGHLAGQSEEVRWSEHDAGLGTPDVAAEGPRFEDSADGEVYAEESPSSDGYDYEVAAAEDATSLAARPAYENAPQKPVADSAPIARATVSRPAKTTAVAGGFSVQVGAFAESDSAEKIAGNLRAKGFPVYVSPKAGSRDGRWRVRVGPLETRSKAEEIAQQLKTREGLPTWVLSEGGG